MKCFVNKTVFSFEIISNTKKLTLVMIDPFLPDQSRKQNLFGLLITAAKVKPPGAEKPHPRNPKQN